MSSTDSQRARAQEIVDDLLYGSGNADDAVREILDLADDAVDEARAAQQPQPVVQALHGDDPTAERIYFGAERPARDDDPVHDAGEGE